MADDVVSPESGSYKTAGAGSETHPSRLPPRLLIVIVVGLTFACSGSPDITKIEPGLKGLLVTWVGAGEPARYHVYRDGGRVSPDEGVLCLKDSCAWLDRNFDIFATPRAVEARVVNSNSWVPVRWSADPAVHHHRYEVSVLVEGRESARSSHFIGTLAKRVVASEVARTLAGETTVDRADGERSVLFVSGGAFRPTLTFTALERGRVRATLTVESATFAVRVARRLAYGGDDESEPTWSSWSEPVQVRPLGARLAWEVYNIGWDGETGEYLSNHILPTNCPVSLDGDAVSCDIPAPSFDNDTLQIYVEIFGLDRTAYSLIETFPPGTAQISLRYR